MNDLNKWNIIIADDNSIVVFVQIITVISVRVFIQWIEIIEWTQKKQN